MGIKELVFVILSSNFVESNINSVDYDSLECMIHNIYHEAANQPTKGKIAVGNVTMNRVKHPKYPNTVCSVVKQARIKDNAVLLNRCQFSWYCDGVPDHIDLYTNGKINPIRMASFEEVVILSFFILNGNIMDNTDGATHYLNPDIARKRKWQDIYTHTASIYEHEFYRRDYDSLL